MTRGGDGVGADADARGSAITLPGLCSGELKMLLEFSWLYGDMCITRDILVSSPLVSQRHAKQQKKCIVVKV